MQTPNVLEQQEISAKQISEINSLWKEKYPSNLKNRSLIFLEETKNYLTPIPFYVKQGFEILTELRLETLIISCENIK